MDTNFKGYKAKQLLDNDFFIHSMITPTPKTKEFWRKEMEEDSLLSDEIDTACSVLQNIRKEFLKNELSERDKLVLWLQIYKYNKRKRNRKVWIYSIGAAAAVALILFLFVPYVFKKAQAIDYKNMIAAVYNVQESEVQLILSQDEKIIIPECNSQILYNKEGKVEVNNKQIKREKKKTDNDKAKLEEKTSVLNQLIVPAGKRSFLTLSDGTKVWVNSGTHLIYPSMFEKDKREIYVDGEIYLEVTHDENRPFDVKTNNMNISVLGTSFNVCAYKEDQQQNVVLIEGKVKVAAEKENHIIHPSEGFILNKSNGKATVKKVETEDYTAWVKGYYLFKQETLQVVAKRLSRYYNIPIICDKQIENLKCSGKLDLKEDISGVFSNLEKALPVKIIKEEMDVKIMSN